MAFRALFAITTYYNLKIKQMDVKTAFLYRPIDQELYVIIPKGYKEVGKVCRLKKALYGLKQSPRIWYKTLLRFLIEKLGLCYLHADY